MTPPAGTAPANKPVDDEHEEERELEEGALNPEDAFDDEFAEDLADGLEEEEEEDLDDDDLIDLDDDDEEEEEEGAEGKEGKEGEGEGEPAKEGEGQPRNADGTFADKPKEGEGAAKPDAAPAAKAGEGEPEKKPDAAAEQAKWQPFAVVENKETHAIEGASVVRANGHVYLGMPEKNFEQFEALVRRGYTGARMWRQLDAAIKEVEARKNAPPPPSDAEIEAGITLEVLKPHLAEILTEEQVENLDLRVKLAQKDAREKYAKEEETRLSKAQEPAWEEVQVHLLTEQLGEALSANPELRVLTKEQLEQVYREELLPYRNAIIWRDGDQPYANTELLVSRLKAKVEAVRAAGATGTPAPSKTAADAAHSPSNAASDKDKGKKDPAERFNRAVDTGAKPRTTSVKANRGKPGLRDRTTRDLRRTARRKTSAEEQEEAEEEFRKAERAYLNSDSLDFEDGSEA